VRAQHKLVTEKLRGNRARAVLGWSMVAAQAYQWITQYPDFVDLAAPFCGSAKTSIHNQVALRGLEASLLAARRHLDKEKSRAWTEEERTAGLRAFGRVMGGWAFGQGFYREGLYESCMGFKSLEGFMIDFWEAWALSKCICLFCLFVSRSDLIFSTL
jgi:hypothetical protein